MSQALLMAWLRMRPSHAHDAYPRIRAFVKTQFSEFVNKPLHNERVEHYFNDKQNRYIRRLLCEDEPSEEADIVDPLRVFRAFPSVYSKQEIKSIIR
jgi:hypothetical protein